MGYFLVSVMGIKGILAPVLVLGVATPTAVNSVIIASEFDNEPEYASQLCFVSTALSVVTVTIVVFLIKRFM